MPRPATFDRSPAGRVHAQPQVLRPLTVLTAPAPGGDPVLDTALSSAVLDDVERGAPGVLRLWRPSPWVSFGRLDRLLPGFPAAVDAAGQRGFTPVLRVGGGRAAAAPEDALVFGVAAPVEGGTSERFAAMAALLLGALGRLDVDARVGELPGEYCPGAWSLHAGGRKVAGIAQRVRRHVAWTEGVLIVRGADRVRDALGPVYEALGLAWDASTAGAVEDLAAGVTWEDAARALRTELATRYRLLEADISPATLARARTLREGHDAAAQAKRLTDGQGGAERGG